jgi:hypothetical protein
MSKIVREIEKTVDLLNSVDTGLQAKLKESIENEDTATRVKIQEAIAANQSLITRTSKLKAQVFKLD